MECSAALHPCPCLPPPSSPLPYHGGQTTPPALGCSPKTTLGTRRAPSPAQSPHSCRLGLALPQAAQTPAAPCPRCHSACPWGHRGDTTSPMFHWAGLPQVPVTLHHAGQQFSGAMWGGNQAWVAGEEGSPCPPVSLDTACPPCQGVTLSPVQGSPHSREALNTEPSYGLTCPAPGPKQGTPGPGVPTPAGCCQAVHGPHVHGAAAAAHAGM